MPELKGSFLALPLQAQPLAAPPLTFLGEFLVTLAICSGVFAQFPDGAGCSGLLTALRHSGTPKFPCQPITEPRSSLLIKAARGCEHWWPALSPGTTEEQMDEAVPLGKRGS